MGERGGWSHPEELTEVSRSWDEIILNTSNLFTNVLTLRTLKTKPIIIIIKSPKSKGERMCVGQDANFSTLQPPLTRCLYVLQKLICVHTAFSIYHPFFSTLKINCSHLFMSTPGDFQELLLALCSGVTIDTVQRTTCDAGYSDLRIRHSALNQGSIQYIPHARQVLSFLYYLSDL